MSMVWSIIECAVGAVCRCSTTVVKHIKNNWFLDNLGSKYRNSVLYGFRNCESQPSGNSGSQTEQEKEDRTQHPTFRAHLRHPPLSFADPPSCLLQTISHQLGDSRQEISCPLTAISGNLISSSITLVKGTCVCTKAVLQPIECYDALCHFLLPWRRRFIIAPRCKRRLLWQGCATICTWLRFHHCE